ncbi:cytochrome c [Pseudomonas sp. SA3-5]|uniref:Cytochrome c n=1 Tax=Pseudomonas aestuarii TaxID=3018340 RepID=A0ABT4X913_9PSED|nr:cytochrome c [Pseudomonas aestuarii]MDA7084866.1 cytochrome c [Pseudomonas aestuarii]
MCNRIARAGLLASLALLATAPAQAQVDGPALYQQHCAKCHGDDGRASNMRGRLLFAQDLGDAKWQEHTSDAQILAAIRNGARMMSGYASKLNLEQQQALVQVVRGLRQP